MTNDLTKDGFTVSPVGYWVGCRWDLDNGHGAAHVDDAELIRLLCPSHLTAECIAVDGEYFVLRYLEYELRVRPYLIRVMPYAAKFPHGTRVSTIIGPNVKTKLESTIRMIVWHFKNGEYTYYIDGDKRRKKRMYFEHQLESAT